MNWFRAPGRSLYNEYGEKKVRKELGNVAFTWKQAFFALAQTKTITNPAYRKNLIRVLRARCYQIEVTELARRFITFWGSWFFILLTSSVAGLSCVKYWYNSDARRAELLAAMCVDCDHGKLGEDRGHFWYLVRGFRKEFTKAAAHLFPVEVELMERVGSLNVF